MEASQWLNDTISLWESTEDHVDESCVSINLYSDYFNAVGDPKDLRAHNRAERRFHRYVTKKYETSLQRGTLKSSSDWDTAGHPAREKRDMDTFILESKCYQNHLTLNICTLATAKYRKYSSGIVLVFYSYFNLFRRAEALG